MSEERWNEDWKLPEGSGAILDEGWQKPEESWNGSWPEGAGEEIGGEDWQEAEEENGGREEINEDDLMALVTGGTGKILEEESVDSVTGNAAKTSGKIRRRLKDDILLPEI